jgi:hypothetical protein
MTQFLHQANDHTTDEPLGEEYEVVPAEFRFHDGSGFCYDPTCPCHEDRENMQALGEAVQEGEVTTEEADQIYRGKTV